MGTRFYSNWLAAAQRLFAAGSCLGSRAAWWKLVVCLVGIAGLQPLPEHAAETAAAEKREPAFRPAPVAAVSQGALTPPRPSPSLMPAGLRGGSHLDCTPPRQIKGLQLVKLGWSYNCMECHKLLPAKWHYDRPMAEHQHIQLRHGENRFCLNCHHPTNRSAFVDYDGSEIHEEEVVLLCAKCHGPIYRDWKAGVHGRRNGYWDPAKGPQNRLRCIQCHDPHDPQFKPMAPLPPLHYPARASGAPVAAHAEPAALKAPTAHP